MKKANRVQFYFSKLSVRNSRRIGTHRGFCLEDQRQIRYNSDNINNNEWLRALMMEMVHEEDSKSIAGNSVRVQVSPEAPLSRQKLPAASFEAKSPTLKRS